MMMGALMFLMGLLVGIIIFMKDESCKEQQRMILEFIYFQLIITLRQRKAAVDDIHKSRCEGEIIALEKLKRYIAALPLQEK